MEFVPISHGHLAMIVAAAASPGVSRVLAGLFSSIVISCPIIGSVRCARSAPRPFGAAIRGGMIWAAIPAVLYDVCMVAMLIGLGPAMVLSTALFVLIVGVAAGALLGALVGAGFVLAGRGKRKGEGTG